MTLLEKNSIPTRFNIDLTSIDVKIEKLSKYFKNCFIDLKDNELRFINSQVDYSALDQSLRNKKYKESLARLVDNTYTKRFVETLLKLKTQGIISFEEFPLLGPLDDFGSKFDTFAAVNTDPNNSILQILNIQPYKELVVDILTKEEFEIYQNNVSSYYDVERLSYILQKLENLTLLYVEPTITFISTQSFIEEFNIKILNAGSTAPPIPSENNAQSTFNLLQTVPNIQNAINLFPLLSFFGINNEQYSNQLFANTLKIVEPEFNSLEKINNIKSVDILEKAKIKVLSFIIKNEIKAVLENKIYQSVNLDNFKSSHDYYDFYKQQFSNSTSIVKKEDLIFKLTFLKKSIDVIQQNNENNLNNNIIEFNAISKLSIQSPFGNSKIKNDKFVAILTGKDLATSAVPVEFFEPTILAILSDIDFIDKNLYEINPTYCPPQEVFSTHVQSNKENAKRNQVIISALTKNKELVDSNNPAFNYYNFPDLYFIPNILQGPSAFYETFEQKTLTPTKAREIIKNYSKYYYNSFSETPAAIVSRDTNMARLFDNTAAQNGFYGFVQIKQDSFADPFKIQQIIQKLNNLSLNAVSEVQSIVLAKTNIACLLKEFQTCFLPKIGNCKDTLRGFRFGELEQFVTKVFPESAYPAIFEIINNFKEQSIRDEREKQLLKEIKKLEDAIQNNPRVKFVFNKLDNKIDPSTAFNMADREIGIVNNISLEQQYKNKLQEYRDFKLNQEQDPEYIEKEKLQIDEFLDTLEKNGINIELLCDLAKIIGDLTKISFTFGSFTLPEFPSIDLFQETKLTLDLSIAEIILQTIIAFIKKILEELLSCNGLKDLIKAAFTGQAEGLTGTAVAALNQLATGKFDLEEFVKNNPQIDPNSYKESFDKLANSLENTLTVSSTGGINANIDVGYAGEVNVSSIQTTTIKLTKLNDVAITEKQMSIALNGLVSELVIILTPQEFIDLFGGSPLNSTLLKVVGHILTNRQDIAYLGDVVVIKNLFNSISQISGLNSVRNELISVANLYSSAGISLTDRFCIDDNITSFENISPNQVGQNAANLPEDLQQLFADRQKFRDLIKDILNCSPENIKSLVDDKVFKPLLVGLLPNGNTIPSIDSSNKKLIKSTLNKIETKFKSSSNALYSKLALKKQQEREIPKELNGPSGSYENPEYKDLINKGGYKTDYSDSITVEEEKIVYGGLFTENFSTLTGSLNILTNDSSITLSLAGEKAYSSKILQDFFSTNPALLNNWKIENIIKDNESVLNIYETNPAQLNFNETFSYKIKNELANPNINDFTENIIKEITNSTIDNEAAKNYIKNTNINYLKEIYTNTIEYINSDGLLKSISNIESDNIADSVINALKQSGIDITNIQQTVFADLNINNVDTALKYINFSPKPTQEQKNKNVDPSLYGKSEIIDLISKILSRRKSEIIDLKTLEEMFEDDDNTLNLSIIDGLLMSMVRALCTDLSLRSLFVIRTFKFNKEYFNNLILQTYMGDVLYKEIESFSNQINKKSFLEIVQQHIEYLHNFKFKNFGLFVNNNNLVFDCEKVKREIGSLKEDEKTLLLYINKIDNNSIDLNFLNSIKEYINCLKKEIETKQIELTKLYLRNLAHNEFIIILDKLSYLTSTNERVLDELKSSCSEQQDINPSINGVIIDNLFKNITNVYSLNNIQNQILDILDEQRSKFANKIFVEHFVYVPLIKSDYFAEKQLQINKKIYGFCNLADFKNLIQDPNIYNTHKNNLQKIFDGSIEYGARIVYMPEATNNSTLQEYQGTKTFIENLNNHNKKSKIYISETQSYELKKISVGNGLFELINLYEKTYSVPYFYPITEENKMMLGFVNAFPIAIEKVNISNTYVTADQIIEYIQSLNNISTNNLLNDIKNKLKCSENLKKLNSLFINNDLLFNMFVFSSLNILGSEQMISNFGNVRFTILNNILTHINIIYNKNNEDFLQDLSEILSSADFFKKFNAELIIKTAIKAAIYVLQYYCQMTDPNISLAMIYRNAVKIIFGLSSQVGGMFGAPIPNEPPLPLNLLAPYSIGQLPVNLFGFPPAGIGVGMPITIPGMILLGAELLLLGIEFAEDIEKNSNNEQIKKKLRELCFELEGYKKYGIE